MDISNILATARKALAMMKEGRSILANVTDAVRDGKVALDTKGQADLNAMLAEEQRETEAAHSSLARAIQAAKDKGQ